MGNGIPASELDDLMNATLYNLGKPSIQLIAQELPEYEVMGRMMKKDKVLFDGGVGIQRTLMLKRNKTAAHKGRYAEDNIDIANLLQFLKVPYVHVGDGWGYDINEVKMNTGDPELMIANIIDPRRANAILNMIEEMEEKFWGSAPGTTNSIDPWGLKYWIVESGTEGFNGGAPGSHTTVGNINPTTYTRWKNWTAEYTNVTPDDLLEKMRYAAWSIRFKSPIQIKNMKNSSMWDYRIYTSWTVYNKFVKLAQQQNDNLGVDLDKFDGDVRFNRMPITAGHQITANDENDVYMVNYKSFYPVVLKGSYMQETKPSIAPKQHLVRQVFIDMDYNFICTNRRANAVIREA